MIVSLLSCICSFDESKSFECLFNQYDKPSSQGHTYPQLNKLQAS